MKPLIGITPTQLIKQPWAPKYAGAGNNYVEAVIAAGGVPVIVPITKDESTLRAIYDLIDGLLLPGGNDIDPAVYGEAPEFRGDKIDVIMSIDRQRDFVDFKFLNWAINDKLPTLGICRGMQLMNVNQGGTLYQDVSRQTPSHIDHLSSLNLEDLSHLAHMLQIKDDSRLSEAINSTKLPVNSLHHQAIHQLGDGLTPVAWSEDGLIEGLENDHFIGLQGHPESLWQTDERWLGIFKWLVEAASTSVKEKSPEQSRSEL